MRFGVLIGSLALLLGCSDFACPDGEPRIDGICPTTDLGLVDPEPITKIIELGCGNNLQTPSGLPGVSLIGWELTVDPGSVPSGGVFGANFKASAVFAEFFLNAAQVNLPGGVSRVNVVRLQATVHVRRGANDPEDVLLTFDPNSIDWTCRYDGNGNAESAGDDFPTCSKSNDNLDGSNGDCTGLGGAPDPRNPCGQFVDIPISSDCGVCESLGNPFPGLDAPPLSLCQQNGFCVLGPLRVPLSGMTDGYKAAESGYVLFGWDDVSTGAEIDQTGGANDGTWDLPDAVFDEEPGPNAMRFIVGDTGVALECTMAVSSWSVFGVVSRDNMMSPAPDHVLISFPIQGP